MVVATQKTFIFTNLTSPYLTVNKNGSKLPAITLAKKKDISETSTPQQQNFPIKLSTSLLPRAAIAVFGLGFIDAGYFSHPVFDQFSNVISSSVLFSCHVKL